MTSDHWTGPMTCAHCGSVHPRVAIATGIEGDPQARYFYVGQRVGITRDEISSSDYLHLHPGRLGDEFRILEVWWCATCDRNRWAEVLIRDDVFAGFRAVRLTPEVIDSADLIATFDLRDAFPEWTGVTLFPDDDWRKPPRPDWIALLRAYLGEHPQ